MSQVKTKRHIINIFYFKSCFYMALLKASCWALIFIIRICFCYEQKICARPLVFIWWDMSLPHPGNVEVGIENLIVDRKNVLGYLSGIRSRGVPHFRVKFRFGKFQHVHFTFVWILDILWIFCGFFVDFLWIH